MHAEKRLAPFEPQHSHADAACVRSAVSRAANAPFIASLRVRTAASLCAAAAEAMHE